MSGDCDGPENNSNTNNTANAGTQPGAADAEAGDLSTRNNGDNFDLDSHEGYRPTGSRSGGHLIERHVGQSDADLIARSNGTGSFEGRRPPEGGSSSYSSRQSAEHFTNRTIQENQVQIKEWLDSNPRRRPREFDSFFDLPTGRHVSANSNSASNVNGSRVVLQADPSRPEGYRIITGHPIPKPSN